MSTEASFSAAYRELEQRMMALAEADGDGYLPNAEPEGPVDYILICMEPSLGGWARSADDARAKVEAGFRNFLASIETAILHFCVQRYLCVANQRYHITDFSKGAMYVKRASSKRAERYDRWYPLLLEELDLCAKQTTEIIAVGADVATHLRRRSFARPFTRVIHYSNQAGPARRSGIKGHEESFRAFVDSVALTEVTAAAEVACRTARVPPRFQEEAMSGIARSALTVSRQELVFNYKLAFEGMKEQSTP